MKELEQLSVYQIAKNIENYKGIDVASAWFHEADKINQPDMGRRYHTPTKGKKHKRVRREAEDESVKE